MNLNALSHSQHLGSTSIAGLCRYRLDLVYRNLAVTPAVELCRSWRLVVGDVSRDFELPGVLQVPFDIVLLHNHENQQLTCHHRGSILPAVGQKQERQECTYL